MCHLHSCWLKYMTCVSCCYPRWRWQTSTRSSNPPCSSCSASCLRYSLHMLLQVLSAIQYHGQCTLLAPGCVGLPTGIEGAWSHSFTAVRQASSIRAYVDAGGCPIVPQDANREAKAPRRFEEAATLQYARQRVQCACAMHGQSLWLWSIWVIKTSIQPLVRPLLLTRAD